LLVTAGRAVPLPEKPEAEGVTVEIPLATWAAVAPIRERPKTMDFMMQKSDAAARKKLKR